MRLLVIDNRDSFTFNLVDYLQRLTGRAPTVVVNDTPWAAVDLSCFDAVVISPGPGSPANPNDLGITSKVLEEFEGPILGVCLGMQAMIHVDGGAVELAPEPVHGRLSPISHTGEELFAGLRQPCSMVRYHSLVATEIPDNWEVTARIDDSEGFVMACRDRFRPRWGVQFHPESWESDDGLALMKNFLGLARTYWENRQPYAVRVLPEAADPAVIAKRVLRDQPWWLDVGRFSLLGDATGPQSRYLTFDLDTDPGDLFEILQGELDRHRIPGRGIQPIPGCDFALGWVGYFGYEIGQLCGAAPMPPAPGADAEFVFADRAIIIDHESDKTYLLSFVGDTTWGDSVEQHLKVQSEVELPQVDGGLRAVHSREEYLDLIAAAKEKLVRGESYEICLTNRIELPRISDPLGVFTHLRQQHPSPRTGYLGYAGNQLLSTTPELFLKVDSHGQVISKPIKGTRGRGKSGPEDTAIADELRANEKDRSENLMIVDLVRNDLSRVCDNVTVTDYCEVETYATVHQLVSTVTGQLRESNTALDAIRAAFPGGSMTGAPKYRTMQIISELEGTWRGVYSGAFGYISTNGAADLSMVIRSVVNNRHGAYYGVGGALLYLSDPVAEYEETLTKLRVLTGLVGEELAPEGWRQAEQQ